MQDLYHQQYFEAPCRNYNITLAEQSTPKPYSKGWLVWEWFVRFLQA